MSACFVCENDGSGGGGVVLCEDAAKWRWIECNQCGIRGPVESTVEEAWKRWRLLGAEVEARIANAVTDANRTAPPPCALTPDLAAVITRLDALERRFTEQYNSDERERRYREEQWERGNVV